MAFVFLAAGIMPEGGDHIPGEALGHAALWHMGQNEGHVKKHINHKLIPWKQWLSTLNMKILELNSLCEYLHASHIYLSIIYV